VGQDIRKVFHQCPSPFLGNLLKDKPSVESPIMKLLDIDDPSPGFHHGFSDDQGQIQNFLGKDLPGLQISIATEVVVL